MRNNLQTLLEGYLENVNLGDIARNSLEISIVGLTTTRKLSLFNLLVQREVVIMSSIDGIT